MTKFFTRHASARLRSASSDNASTSIVTGDTEGLDQSPSASANGGSCNVPASQVMACPMGGGCRVEGPGRGKCPHCRFKKCLDLGMNLTPPGGESGCDISQIPCRVCSGPSSGFHFGALTCEGCKVCQFSVFLIFMIMSLTVSKVHFYLLYLFLNFVFESVFATTSSVICIFLCVLTHTHFEFHISFISNVSS
ncbi:unnamed protein product [Protopolystoma xenopodis]|uniref:Nuclear receptor domain-containing protein n=1 Tax=Protopolystoma xenopodis TaxID=117903 RepID=A0A448WSS9_9PLAT|nr:unnamed protein product [Protopolystoma xenopodis]